MDRPVRQGLRRGQKLIATDGLAALKLCVEAAGRGNRDAPELLARHLRRGTGQLPLSAELADLFSALALKIRQADAEVGDAYAAYYLGHALIGHAKIEGNVIAKDPVAGLAWLHYAAARGHRNAAVSLGERATRDDLPKDPAAARHWYAVTEMISRQAYSQLIPIPPRRLARETIVRGGSRGRDRPRGRRP